MVCCVATPTKSLGRWTNQTTIFRMLTVFAFRAMQRALKSLMVFYYYHGRLMNLPFSRKTNKTCSIGWLELFDFDVTKLQNDGHNSMEFVQKENENNCFFFTHLSIFSHFNFFIAFHTNHNMELHFNFRTFKDRFSCATIHLIIHSNCVCLFIVIKCILFGCICISDVYLSVAIIY